MGTLKYDGTSVEFPDRVLAHVELVVIQKLRRQESFLLSWRESEGGGARTGIWLHPAALLTFHYATTVKAIDRKWIEHLAASASSATGMVVVNADGEPVSATDETQQ